MSYAADITETVTSSDKHPLSLESYVETTKRITLDPWQRDICRRLEETFWLANFDRFEKAFAPIGNAKYSL